MIYDAIVIGAGLAGLIGGLRLAEEGYSVLLIAKGHGATHWAAGTIDLLDAQRPRAAIARMVEERSDHPYAYAGLSALDAALARLQQLCRKARYPLVGSAERSTLLPTAAGALRPTALFPATMAAGAGDAGPILVAGFRQLRDFYPPLIAANLRAQGVEAHPLYLDLPTTTRQLDFPTVALADLFEESALRVAVGRQLRLARQGATRIALPAVLGRERATETIAELQELSGALIFEIATLPPSVPGMRLYDLLARAFRQAGGRIQIGAWVSGTEADGPTLRAMFTEAAARRQRHRARCFLLATGGILGGGIRANHQQQLYETALGLPIRLPAGREDWFSARFLAQGGHPIYRTGIAVDRRLRPLNAHGDVIFSNVAVAGAALGGAELIGERCYEGVALSTGWRAAESLIELLRADAPRPEQHVPSLSS